MKNNLITYCISFLIIFLINLNAYSQEQFNFEVTEIEILENGNIYKGLNRGIIITDDGIKIIADEFIYNKNLNILNANGNIELIDTIKNLKITTERVKYLKNEEKIFTEGNSKALDQNGIELTANRFEYDKFKNIFDAYENVKIINPKKNYVIYANDQATYFKKIEKISTKGKTKSIIKSKYIMDSYDVIYLINENLVSSKEEATINDLNSNFYFLENFIFDVKEEILKGEDILVVTNFGLPKSDTMYFSGAHINFKEKSFIAENTKVKVHKDVFDDTNNDPRIVGVSAKGKNDITRIKKGLFTSCGINEKCPPWSVQAEEIIHDKNKKQIEYKNAFIKIYDWPVFYLPKFFHPDPTVKRQSGFLKPQLNNSSILGSSIYTPYFKVFSENKDLTLRPTIFDSDIYMLQAEYRQENKNSSFIGDIGFATGYKSTLQNNKNSLSHFFAKFNKDLKLPNFLTSSLNSSIKKVSNDTYLKVFDNSLSETPLSPGNRNVMSNSVQMILDHEKFNFDTGMTAYEDLTKKNSDRYQYVFPYYNFDKSFYFDNLPGSFNLSSSGRNTLKNTNNLKSNIFNDLKYNSKNYISNLGFKNNFNFYFKNSNFVAKKDSKYKNSPTIRFENIYEFESSFPLSKKTINYSSSITPKISYRINPGDMKDQGTLGRRINVGNIFSINRLGIEDEFESGQSLTYGVNYRKSSLQKEQFFDYTLSAVLRDKKNEKIPESTSINNKNSNIFGSLKNKLSENIFIDYNFSVDNDLTTFHYNSISTTFKVNNFVTKFNFVEENNKYVDTNTLSNVTTYNFAEDNFITFKTRRNRKINLTEYYDLIYEYKKDCLVAGLKYRKTYYEDRELKPKEDLLFTITLIPLTTYEHNFDR